MYETNVERESRIQKRDLNEVSNRKGLPILSVSKYLLPSRPAAFVLQKMKYVEEVVEAAPRLDSVDEVREKGKKGVEVKVANERPARLRQLQGRAHSGGERGRWRK